MLHFTGTLWQVAGWVAGVWVTYKVGGCLHDWAAGCVGGPVPSRSTGAACLALPDNLEGKLYYDTVT
eukprot:4861660-Prorocentrum_lima.AAC.1